MSGQSQDEDERVSKTAWMQPERDRSTRAYAGTCEPERVSETAWTQELAGGIVAGGAGASDAPVSFTIRRVRPRWRQREDGSALTLSDCLRPVLAHLGRDGRAFVLVVDLPEAEQWCRAAAQAGASRVALLVAECSRATTDSGLENDVTVDARDPDQVFFVRHLKDGQHLVCLDLPTGKTSEEGLAQAISAVAQETVSVRAAIFWQAPPRPRICLVAFSAAKRLTESEMLDAAGVILPTATCCLMDVKDVGEHRPEFLVVAKSVTARSIRAQTHTKSARFHSRVAILLRTALASPTPGRSTKTMPGERIRQGPRTLADFTRGHVCPSLFFFVSATSHCWSFLPKSGPLVR